MYDRIFFSFFFFFLQWRQNLRIIRRYKEHQLQSAAFNLVGPFPGASCNHHTDHETSPLVPFDFLASTRVRVPRPSSRPSSVVANGLKADEPKLFTWSGLGSYKKKKKKKEKRTTVGFSWRVACMHRTIAVDRRNWLCSGGCWHEQSWRTLWNEFVPFLCYFSPFAPPILPVLSPFFQEPESRNISGRTLSERTRAKCMKSR